MKLHQLQALVGAVEHGSIRAAARAMHLTQAALTKSLRQLEDKAGVALLVRGSRGVLLTEAGQRLHARAQLVTRQIALAREDLRQTLGQEDGEVRAALTPYLMLTVLGETFHWFRKRYPRVELRLMEGLLTRVLPALRDGSLDFAILATSGEVSTQEFAVTQLQVNPQVLAVREGHPLLKRCNAAQLAALEWVLPGPMAVGMDPATANMFAQAGMAAPAQITRCDALAAMALVRQSDAVTIMPTPLLGRPESHGLVTLPQTVLQPPPVAVLQVSRPEVPLTPAAAYFARCLNDAISGR
jgi:LysR family transcriptional regulator of abg operon